jgi:hypothetical protein
MYWFVHCDNFLTLEAVEEVMQLREKLNSLQIQIEQAPKGEGNCDADRNEKELQLQNEVSAMQEMLSMLTEQKLQFTMEVSCC